MTPVDSSFVDHDRLARTPAHGLALACLAAGIDAADPARLTREAVSLSGSTLSLGEASYDLAAYDACVALGGGNAAGVVAAELASILGDRLSGGVVVTDDPAATERTGADAPRETPDHTPTSDAGTTDRLDVRRGDHPLPSERGVAATRDLLSTARAADDRTLVIAVVTGGGSALMAAPAGDLSLSALQATTDALLASGATIAEINAVRKHCSAIKGGRLAAALAPADVCGLLLSDVVGNDLSTIASGPFVPDETTYEAALAVLDRYDLAVPESVRSHLQRGSAGEIAETPTGGDPAFERVRTVLLGDNLTALRAAADRAADAGFEPMILSSRIRGEAREAATTQVAIAEESRATGEPIEPPAVVVSGGETTVTVRGDGVGGPNQEFALAAACELTGDHEAAGETTDIPPIVVAAVDTDGIDGPTDAAGGLVDSGTVRRAVVTADYVDNDDAAADTTDNDDAATTDDAAGSDDAVTADSDVDATTAAQRALADNDANAFLQRAGALLRTGATGTNVNDLRVIVVPDVDSSSS